MSLTVTRVPGDQNLVKNPVVWELTTDNEYSTDGVVVNQTIELDVIPSDGDTLTLEWLNGGRDITFTFKDSPDDSGLQLDRSGAHANVASYILNLLLSELKANYLINKDFEVSYLASDKVLFVAKEAGDDYEFTLSSSGVYSPTFTVTQSGVDPVIRDNFRVVAELAARYNGDAAWQKAELELVPVESECIFNFQHLLQAFDKLVLPSLSTIIPVDASAQVIEFQTRFAEAFGTTISVQRSLQYDTKYGIYGGFDLRDRLGVNFESAVLPEFLTHRNNTNIRENQPYFLTYWNGDTELTSEGVTADFTYTDGTTAPKTLYSKTFLAYGLYLLPVSHSILDAASDAGKVVKTAIIKTGSQLSGVRLNIDRKNVKSETIIAYRNAYGVLETECFTGEVLKTFETESQSAEVWRRWDAAYQDARMINYGGKQVYGLEVNSGWFSKDRAELLADLLSSDRHYLVLNNKYLPVRFKADDYELNQTRRGSFNSFKLELLFIQDKNYSDVGDRIS